LPDEQVELAGATVAATVVVAGYPSPVDGVNVIVVVVRHRLFRDHADNEALVEGAFTALVGTAIVPWLRLVFAAVTATPSVHAVALGIGVAPVVSHGFCPSVSIA
jgi:hypothetical protein